MTLSEICALVDQIAAEEQMVPLEQLRSDERMTTFFPDGYLAMEATITWFDEPRWVGLALPEVGEIRIAERNLRYGILDKVGAGILRRRLKK